GRLDALDARRRPEVVRDAVGPAKAGGGDDFFVVDPLAAVAGLVLVGGVPLAGDGAALEVERHNRGPRLWATQTTKQPGPAADGSRLNSTTAVSPVDLFVTTTSTWPAPQSAAGRMLIKITLVWATFTQAFNGTGAVSGRNARPRVRS